jgi:hypothetical protein
MAAKRSPSRPRSRERATPRPCSVAADTDTIQATEILAALAAALRDRLAGAANQAGVAGSPPAPA